MAAFALPYSSYSSSSYASSSVGLGQRHGGGAAFDFFKTSSNPNLDAAPKSKRALAEQWPWTCALVGQSAPRAAEPVAVSALRQAPRQLARPVKKRKVLVDGVIDRDSRTTWACKHAIDCHNAIAEQCSNCSKG